MRRVIRLAVLFTAVFLLTCKDKNPEVPSTGLPYGLPNFFFLKTPDQELVGSSPGITEYYNTLLDYFGGSDTLDGELYRIPEKDTTCYNPVWFNTPTEKERYYCFPDIPGAHVVMLDSGLVAMIYAEH